jgi:hypothetical protein
MIRDEYLEQFRLFLAQPESQGRPMTLAEMSQGSGLSTGWLSKLNSQRIYQEWKQYNKSAPIEAERHFSGLARSYIAKVEGKKIVSVDMSSTDTINPQKAHFITKEIVKEGLSKLNSMRSPKRRAIIKSKGVLGIETKDFVQVQVTEEEALLDRIREAYVLVDVGVQPTIRQIMKDFGLLDNQSLATGSLTEVMVRERMVAENWAHSRDEHIAITFDYRPAELASMNYVRTMEAQKIVFEELRLMYRDLRQYRRQGFVTTLDEKTRLAYDYDPAATGPAIAAMAESVKRLGEQNRSNNILNITLNSAQTAGSSSIENRELLARLSLMTTEEKEAEMRHWDQIEKSFDEDNKPSVTIEEIEAADLEAEYKVLKEKEEQNYQKV